MSEAARAIRDAIALGEFGKARKLWDGYAKRLEASISAGSASEDMLAEARETVEWCRLAVKAQTVQAANLVSSARVAQIYGTVPRVRRSRLVRTSG